MSRIKEIWCMHHSHLDIGYTHPQPMLMELQGDYIEQAMTLCEKTRDWPEESQFKWTCEATYPVVKWMEHAEKEKTQQFIRLVSEERISISALPMHTTPCSTDMQMIAMLKELNELRKKTSGTIETAINHDVNGQPWTISQILLDSGVNFYMTGINIHFGGIPYKRPMAFRWKTPDGRELLSYVGEHYSLFSQFCETCENNTKRMHKGIVEYVNRLDKQGHDWDFAFLTATNPPLFDNNCPDITLADLIRRYNEEGHEFKVRFATPEMLRNKLLSMGEEKFPIFGGDWTDYWNFGCASSARETKVNKMALKTLESAGVLECITEDTGSRYQAIRKEAEKHALIYNEHTWGASQAITDPENYESQSQYIQKVCNAYRAADLAGYLVNNRMETLMNNPHQSDEMEGIVVVNPTSVTQEVDLKIPTKWMQKERQLSSIRAKNCIPYLDNSQPRKYFAHVEKTDCGTIQLPPFGGKVIPFEELSTYKISVEEEMKFKREKGLLETPYYKVFINENTGRIIQIYDKNRKKEIMDTSKEMAFFEIIRETVDGRFHPEDRSTLYPREEKLCNENISCWNTEWKAKRIGAERISQWNLEICGHRAILKWTPQMPEVGEIEQEIIFYSNSNYMDLKVKLIKKPVHKPEGIYLTFPLKLAKGWECSYNTAGQFVKLDEEQLGKVCREWVTVDNGVAIYDKENCYGLACPHAPLVQVGDFHFGREQHSIERHENPLLLAWPLNNYWDTNFVSGQSGAMEFAYRFFCRDDFEPNQVYGEFVRAEQRGLIGAAVEAKPWEKIAVKAEPEGFITALYKAKGTEGGIILVFRNRELQRREVSFEIPGWECVNAYEVDLQEVKRKEILSNGTKITLQLEPNDLKFVHAVQLNKM